MVAAPGPLAVHALTCIYSEWHIVGVTDATWSALMDPHRRAVLDLLRERACAVSELLEELGLTQPTVSKHLRVLRDVGLVQVRKAAQRRIYTIEPAPMVELDAWLAPYRYLWNDRLDALGRHLDNQKET